MHSKKLFDYTYSRLVFLISFQKKRRRTNGDNSSMAKAENDGEIPSGSGGQGSKGGKRDKKGSSATDKAAESRELTSKLGFEVTPEFIEKMKLFANMFN